jgi:hypothetical protein
VARDALVEEVSSPAVSRAPDFVRGCLGICIFDSLVL